MVCSNKKRPYIPRPETIARVAAEIHQENLQRMQDEDDPTLTDRRGGPELLLLAVLKNAVSTLEEWSRRYNNFHSRPYEFAALRKNAMHALGYVMSDETEYITSFRSICEETGADADAVRHVILSRLDPAATRQLVGEW